jgi:GxxExxY protein
LTGFPVANPRVALNLHGQFVMSGDQVSYAVIGEAMWVHRELGPGLDEAFYHALLSHRLQAAGIEHLSKPREALIRRGRTADIFEPDLVLPSHLIPELKIQLRWVSAPTVR